MEQRWNHIGKVPAWRKNLARRARRKAAQERAWIREKQDAEMLCRGRNHMSIKNSQLSYESTRLIQIEKRIDNLEKKRQGMPEK